MIIRYRNSSGEITDLFADSDDIDYWVDTQKMALYLEIRGKKILAAKSKLEKRLLDGMDRIYEAAKTDGFADLTSLV